MLDQFLRLPDVVKATGYSKSEIYRQMAAGSFPKSRTYRANPAKRFWLMSEIQAWQNEQIIG